MRRLLMRVFFIGLRSLVYPWAEAWAVEGAQEHVDRDTPVSGTSTTRGKKLLDTLVSASGYCRWGKEETPRVICGQRANHFSNLLMALVCNLVSSLRVKSETKSVTPETIFILIVKIGR
jgi:hypothetical protein